MLDIYSRIENAMVARLRAGLSVERQGMVREVGTYGGELDDDLGRVVSRFPAAWVTFGGITGTKPYSTSRTKWVTTGLFVVMVGQQNARGEAATRQGGGRPLEIGSNALVFAVRRLLIQQDLTDQDPTLKITPFRPRRVRTMFNTRLQDRAVAAFGVEMETDWIESALPNTAWPRTDAPPDDEHDGVFSQHSGDRTPPDPWLEGVNLKYHLDPSQDLPPDAIDRVDLHKEDS